MRGLRVSDSSRPGDVVALDFYGPDHHLVIDAAVTSIYRNAVLVQCSKVPGYAASQREYDKFYADSKSTQPVSRFHGGSHTLVPYVMEDGGRTGNQGQALLRLLAERAVASGHVVAPLLWGPVTPASLVALTVRKWQQLLSSWLHKSLSTLLHDGLAVSQPAWADVAGTPPPARTAR